MGYFGRSGLRDRTLDGHVCIFARLDRVLKRQTANIVTGSSAMVWARARIGRDRTCRFAAAVVGFR